MKMVHTQFGVTLGQLTKRRKKPTHFYGEPIYPINKIQLYTSNPNGDGVYIASKSQPYCPTEFPLKKLKHLAEQNKRLNVILFDEKNSGKVTHILPNGHLYGVT